MPSIRSWRRAAAAGFASFNFAGRVTARHLVRVFDQFRDDSLTVVAAVGVLGDLVDSGDCCVAAIPPMRYLSRTVCGVPYTGGTVVSTI